METGSFRTEDWETEDGDEDSEPFLHHLRHIPVRKTDMDGVVEVNKEGRGIVTVPVAQVNPSNT